MGPWGSPAGPDLPGLRTRVARAGCARGLAGCARNPAQALLFMCTQSWETIYVQPSTTITIITTIITVGGL
eukprot:1187279-Lingulodinium_polyedra.AAC.1